MSMGSHESSLPSLDDLESLFVNNPDLEDLRAQLSRFNPIKTMGMERMEIRHSAILAWLLSPQETHGLGDMFLKAFISEALRGYNDHTQPTALDVSQADMMDTEVRREWRNIDLLIASPRNGWVFVIENKFDSKQHSNQLTTYFERVRYDFDQRTYPHVRGIFLTLWDEDPEDDRYAPVQYSAICEILKQQALSGRYPLTAEVKMFLTHYLDVILEATGMSEEQKSLEKLARQLYRDHKRVLDFIVEHGKATNFSIACDTVFGDDLDYGDICTVENRKFVYNYSDANLFSFLPKTWFDALGGDDHSWHGCEDWWMGFPVMMWLQLITDDNGKSGKIRFFAEVGPISDYHFRRELIDAIREKASSENLSRIGFQRGASDEGRRYSRMFKQNTFAVADVYDNEKIANAITKSLKSFRPEMDAIESVLPSFLSYGQEKRNQ